VWAPRRRGSAPDISHTEDIALAYPCAKSHHEPLHAEAGREATIHPAIDRTIPSTRQPSQWKATQILDRSRWLTAGFGTASSVDRRRIRLGVHRSPTRLFIEFAEHREYTQAMICAMSTGKCFGRTDKFYLKQSRKRQTWSANAPRHHAEHALQERRRRRFRSSSTSSGVGRAVVHDLAEQDSVGVVTFDTKSSLVGPQQSLAPAAIACT